MYQYVKTYIENGAGYIILNDPKKLNALSQPMAAELSEVLEQFRFDPQIRVIVLRGEGGRFCGSKRNCSKTSESSAAIGWLKAFNFLGSLRMI